MLRTAEARDAAGCLPGRTLCHSSPATLTNRKDLASLFVAREENKAFCDILGQMPGES